jgi:hypothetical protein
MQTSLEAEGRLTPPQPLAAANEEFARQAQQPSSPAAGWDPFEVWRTRVKAAQEAEAAAKSGAQIA